MHPVVTAVNFTPMEWEEVNSNGQAGLSRVEEQVTMFRLRHTSVSRFPRRGSLSACHASRPDPPSSNPACGFPALGFPGNSRLGHSQGVAQFDRSQIHQPQRLKVFVCRPPFRCSKGPLAPSLKMCYQAKFKKTVDLAKGLAWITIIEIVAPAC